MSLLRSSSASRLFGLLFVVIAVGAGLGIGAVTAFGGSGSAPAPSPLDAAIRQALSAQSVDGITARVRFTNHLVSSDVLPDGAALGPLISGATGRLWVTGDGRVRLELQADAGDTEILLDGRMLTVYDVHTNTVYRLKLPSRATTPDGPNADQMPPTLDAINSALARLGDYATLSGAEPGTVAGQPTYTVRLEPKDSGGLLGAVEVAWDAAHGVPLRVGVYARGDSSPTLQLVVTDISYGAVSPDIVTITPPATANVTDLGQLSPMAVGEQRPTDTKPVEGVADVSAALPFSLLAPDALNGLSREHVRLVGLKDAPAALIVYGKGLGAVAVLERAAEPSTKNPLDNLPTVSITGAKAHELATPLGTILAFDRSGVSFVVAASAKPADVEAAALGLG